RNGVILDLHGGYAMHYGVLNLKNSKPSTGVEWAQTRISFTDKVYQPFYGIRIGFGRNEFHTSTHVMGGIQFFNVQNSQNSEYVIKDKGSNTSIPIESETGLHYRVHVGYSVGF